MNLETQLMIHDIPWRVLPVLRKSAPWHMALDESLFTLVCEKVQDGQHVHPILRLYQFSEPAVILGYQQKPTYDSMALADLGGKVTTRITGGGHMLFFPDDLHFSVIIPVSQISQDILQAYETLNGVVAAGLRLSGYPVTLKRTCVKLNDKTLVGTAQRWAMGKVLLHHGSILSRVDRGLLGSVLRASKQEEELLHRITSLEEYKDKENVNMHEVSECLIRSITNGMYFLDTLTQEEEHRAQRLVQEKYENLFYLQQGTKHFGVCYIAGLLQEYSQYIKNNTVQIAEAAA